MDANLTYLQNQVNSATPAGLVIMLYDGLIKFASSMCDTLASNETDAQRNAADLSDRCIRIVTELNNSLQHDQSPELCERLSNLYAFFIAEFSRAIAEHDPKIVSGMIPLIKELRDSWQQADQTISFQQSVAE